MPYAQRKYPLSLSGITVMGYGAAVLGDKVSGWWVERRAFTLWVWPRRWLSVLWMCCWGCAPGDRVKSRSKGSALQRSGTVSPPLAAGCLLLPEAPLYTHQLPNPLGFFFSFFCLFHVKRGNQRETEIICLLSWRYGLKFLFSGLGKWAYFSSVLRDPCGMLVRKIGSAKSHFCLSTDRRL